jgi:hypothetical protein
MLTVNGKKIEVVVAYFKVLFEHLPGGAEEKYEKVLPG